MSRLCLIVGIVALFAVGCTREQPATPATAPAVVLAAPISVKVTTPQRQTMKWTVEQPGTVLAFETTPIIAKLSGYITKIHVDRGDRVNGPTASTPGTLLAEVSIPELEQEGKQKAALVEQAIAEVTQAKRNGDVAADQVIAAEAGLTEAKAVLTRVGADIERWASELKRMENLVGGRVVDSQTLDETRKQFKATEAMKSEAEARIATAVAAVRTAKSKRALAEADALVAEAKQKVAAAEADRVRTLLGYTQIRAPYSGIVTTRYVDTGHLIPSSGTKLEPLFVLARNDKLRVAVDVPESAATKVAVGSAAVVKFASLNGREVAAKVSRTSGVLAPDTRTLRVEIDLPNPDGSLMPGLFSMVKFTTTNSDVLTVPTAAVLVADETAYCFIIQDGKATKYRVRTGRTDSGQIEILAKRPASLTTGDWESWAGSEKVVVGNLGALVDGQLVTDNGP
jgi:RND family efflux transporter MFP subunit